MILKFVTLLVTMAITSSVILYFFAGNKLESSYYEAHSSIKSMWDILGPTVLATNFISLIVISIATIYVILFISHKIAGPLFKLEKNIQEIAEGNLDLHVHLREGDQVQTLGTALGSMVDTLAGRIKAMKDVTGNLAALEEKLQQLKGKETVSGEEISKIHSQLKDQTTRLNSELEKFKLKTP